MTAKKRTLFIIILITILALSVLFLVLGITTKISLLQQFFAYSFILALIFAFAFVLMNLPQTIAGNFFNAIRLKSDTIKNDTISQYCAKEFLESEKLEKIVNKKCQFKISKVSRDKQKYIEYKKAYIVTLRDYSKFSVRMNKKNKDTDERKTTSWLICDITKIN